MSVLDRLVEGGCEETQARLSEHLEGELRGWRRLRVLRHLARCERCQSVLRSLARVVEHLQGLPRDAVSASPSTVDAVVRRIRGEDERFGQGVERPVSR